VSITAGTVYLVSYYAPVGHDAADGQGLASGVDNSSLYAVPTAAMASTLRQQRHVPQ